MESPGSSEMGELRSPSQEACCVALGKSLHLSELLFPVIRNGDRNPSSEPPRVCMGVGTDGKGGHHYPAHNDKADLNCEPLRAWLTLCVGLRWAL